MASRPVRSTLLALSAITSFLAAPRALPSQDRGAAALGELVAGLGTTTRVLMIGAHPDDEDTNLIAWLARGRRVETAYLSLTRGDGGQNIIGDELGEALGLLRTEELLAARRIDGGRQYFARAYDFGFSRSADETLRHWPKDSLLGDVVRTIRAFRPHVIVAVFRGTPADGHGHHQVSGILAREGYDVAGDTARFPVATHGVAWTPAKFYRAARFSADSATLSMDVGELSALRGRSYAELAAESRSQHRSQAFGALQRRGKLMDHVQREHSRAPAPADPRAEKTLFDGIDTTWARLRDDVSTPAARRALDSIPAAVAEARRTLDLFAPAGVLPALGRLERLLGAACGGADAMRPCQVAGGRGADLIATADVARTRVHQAMALAAGVALEANAPRTVVATGAPVEVELALYNRGTVPLVADFAVIAGGGAQGVNVVERAETVAPGEALRKKATVRFERRTEPWWLASPRTGDLFSVPVDATPEQARSQGAIAHVHLRLPDGTPFMVTAPLVHRRADQVRGTLEDPVVAATPLSVTLEATTEYLRAGTRVDRPVRVLLRSASLDSVTARVALELPVGLRADSAARTVTLSGHLAERTVQFQVTGTLPAGEHRIAAVATVNGARVTSGHRMVAYEHVRPRPLWREAATRVQAVEVALPDRALRIGYVRGVSDNVILPLRQLGLDVVEIEPGQLAATDLSRFTTLVVGPRAYDAHPALVARNRRLLEWVKAGGTMVVQYGQGEMARPGIMPLPITAAVSRDRVTEEDAPVRVLDPEAQVLRWPNRITERDWAGWVQERGLYMPRTMDAGWRRVVSMNDPGEPPIDGAILLASHGKGTYVYTSLAFFRQLPAGVPGAARLFVNLLAAGTPAPRTASR